ncbi:hypothetical protein J2Y60_004333 [Arcicella sp. BE140]|nr:hypothetical protein [Arcicella sp. BE51]MDR6814117.1 hypothetical protein [Arcicella sp. BE140]MDR6825429.1 hypothetical protein [Arcicella sp. BE139]
MHITTYNCLIFFILPPTTKLFRPSFSHWDEYILFIISLAKMGIKSSKKRFFDSFYHIIMITAHLNNAKLALFMMNEI